jgi:hypothetical protein
MDKENYRPRLLIVLVIALVIGQVLSVNYLKKDFENRITQCYEAINTNSVLQGALVNILVEKKILERSDLLKEAGKLSTNLRDMIDKMKELEKQYKEFEKNGDIKQ